MRKPLKFWENDHIVYNTKSIYQKVSTIGYKKTLTFY